MRPRFVRGHAGGRLVEQQHLRLEAERDGDLDQALPAVGQVLAPARSASSARPSRSSSCIGLVDDLARCAAGRRAHVAARRRRVRRSPSATFSSTGRPRNSVVDLERAAEAALDARCLATARDVLAAEQDAARGRRERAGQHVDEAWSCRRRSGRSARGARPARAGSRCRSATVSAPKLLHSRAFPAPVVMPPPAAASRVDQAQHAAAREQHDAAPGAGRCQKYQYTGSIAWRSWSCAIM